MNIGQLEHQLHNTRCKDSQIRIIRELPQHVIADNAPQLQSLLEQYRSTADSDSAGDLEAYTLFTIAKCKMFAECHAEAKRDYLRCLELFSALGLAEERAATLRMLGVNCLPTGDFSDALHYLPQSIAAYSSIDDKAGLGSVYGDLAYVHSVQRHPLLALEYCTMASSLIDDNAGADVLSTFYFQAGLVYQNQREFQKAITYYNKVLELYSDGITLRRTINVVIHIVLAEADLAAARKLPFNIAEAEARLLALLPTIRERDLAKFEYQVQLFLGALYARTRDFETALKYFFQARDLLDKLENNQSNYAELFLDIGKSYYELGQFQDAIEFLERALDLGKTVSEDTAVVMIAGVLSEAYRRLGNDSAALRYLMMYNESRSGIQRREAQKARAAIEMKSDLDKLHDELEQHKVRNQNLREQAEQTSKEARSTALQLTQMNGTISAIERRIRSELQAPKKKYAAFLRSLLVQVGDAMQSEQDWELFEKRFTEVQPEFLARLAARYPNLTRNELRVCSLLQLNVSTKEIAQLLGISYRSVETVRYRIRKKIRLAPGADLSTVFACILPPRHSETQH